LSDRRKHRIAVIHSGKIGIPSIFRGKEFFSQPENHRGNMTDCFIHTFPGEQIRLVNNHSDYAIIEGFTLINHTDANDQILPVYT
jgi:hypothetical protein